MKNVKKICESKGVEVLEATACSDHINDVYIDSGLKIKLNVI